VAQLVVDLAQFGVRLLLTFVAGGAIGVHSPEYGFSERTAHRDRAIVRGEDEPRRGPELRLHQLGVREFARLMRGRYRLLWVASRLLGLRDIQGNAGRTDDRE